MVTHNLNKAGQVGGLESLLLSYKGCVWGYGTFGRKVGVGSGILVYIYIYKYIDLDIFCFIFGWLYHLILTTWSADLLTGH